MCIGSQLLDLDLKPICKVPTLTACLVCINDYDIWHTNFHHISYTYIMVPLESPSSCATSLSVAIEPVKLHKFEMDSF